MGEVHVTGDVSGQVAVGDVVRQVQQGGPPRPQRPRVAILFWAANPIDTDRLRLDEEVRTIDERLRAGSRGEVFELHQQWALRATDLSDGLLRHRPAIVHFSGHGSPSGLLALERDDGTAGPVTASALAGLFAAVADGDGAPVRCLVLNSCWSRGLAEAVAAHVDCVVGTPAELDDRAAISFAAGFYRALAHGRSVATAVEVGRNEIDLVVGDAVRPRLVSRVDAREVRFA